MKPWAFALGLALGAALYAQQQPEKPAETEPDPFADVKEAAPPDNAAEQADRSWKASLFGENFGFRREIMSQFDYSDGRGGSRQSVGFEVLKKWSTATATVASFDFQGRFVRRDGYHPVLNDRYMTDPNAANWQFEYHNFYADFYNVLNPMLGDEQKRENVGRFNFRAGHFYTPFGLNLQTDTHGTVLQLSNEENFGFDRDWYTGFWGSINKHLNYDAYYAAGSGYDLKWKGQSGLGAVRISLGNRYSNLYGVEGGVSAVAGERLSMDMENGSEAPLKTQRYGVDGRYRRPVPKGLMTFSTELTRGRDGRDDVATQLYQAEYLHSSRKWGLASQYRDFSRDRMGRDSSIIGEATWYFKNDVGNANAHWIKLNVEKPLKRSGHDLLGTVVALQYYFYW